MRRGTEFRADSRGEVDIDSKVAERYTAKLLETSASGYAAYAADHLLEHNPELSQRYGPSAFAEWKSQFQQWCTELGAAMDAADPRSFESRICWTMDAFVARGLPREDIALGLGSFSEALTASLPEESSEKITQYLEKARAGLGRPSQAGEEHRPDPKDPRGRAVLHYLKTLLEGNGREAVDQVVDMLDSGKDAQHIYSHLLLPALREAGRLWHVREISVAEEHYITANTKRAMALVGDRCRTENAHRTTVILGSVKGNVHDVGITALSDLFEIDGWNPICLGADVPIDEVARAVQFFDAHLVVLAAMLLTHVKIVRQTIDRINESQQDVKIIVGGLAFDQARPSLWRDIGATAYAKQITDVIPMSRELVTVNESS